jgi:hypothetical protein
MTEYHIYVFIALLVSIYLTIKNNPDNKFITFIIAFWILAGSVLNTEYFIIDIQSLPFDFQPDRIIFILFSIYLFFTYISEHNSERFNTENLKFEKYLYIYIFLSITVDIIHTIGVLSLKDVILNATKILTFLVIYLVLKRTADREMLKVAGKALLIVCTISSLIGIYQFLIDPFFFRIGSERIAFAGYLRSNGIFGSELIQSYFLIPGIVVALFTIRNNLLKYSLIALFLLGIIFTFHRMSWIIVMLTLTLYLIKVKKKDVWQIIAVGVYLVVALTYFSSTFSLNLTNISRSAPVQERLLQETMSGRIECFTMVLENIPQSWLIGFGSRKSKVYYSGMLEVEPSYASGERGGIHNGYLAIMFYRGIPVMILYTFFLILAFYNFWTLAKFKHIFYFIPFFELMKYILLNITNRVALYNALGLLFAIFLGTGVAIYQKNIDMSDVIINE